MIDTEDYKKGFKDGFKYGQAKAIRPKSFWIAEKADKRHYHYYCDNCGCESRYRKSRYCPDCGYEMENQA